MGSPPSAQRYLGLIWLPAALYPDSIDYDVYDQVAQFYKLFYHCDLTEDMYRTLTAMLFLTEAF
jgi:iron complex transport system substrate-binding protein